MRGAHGSLSSVRSGVSTKWPAAQGRLRSRARNICCNSSSTYDKTKDYNRLMKQQMGWEHVSPYEYHFDRGLYYHEIDRNVLLGSQPRNPEDLQQDKDMQHWGVNLESLRKRCQEVGINLVRRPARDFDPHSLRKTLPSAVQALHETVNNGGRVYVHCTAGLGRAPAVGIAFLYWFRNMNLDEAYKYLTDIRPCGPKRDAIRGATYDLLSTGSFDAFNHLPADAYATLADEDRYALQYRVLRGT